ncbi:hypothetical protein QQ045_022484 [Rhodiola kirilowii]
MKRESCGEQMMAKEGVGGDVDDVAERLKGKLVVSLEDEDWEKMSAEFKWALVLKLVNGMAFNLTGLSNVPSKIWNLELDKRVRFKELVNNMALAEFVNVADMISQRRRSVVMFGHGRLDS